MTDAPNIFEETGIQGLTTAITRLMGGYSGIMGAVSSNYPDLPHYIKDLMGNNKLRSFAMHKAGYESTVIDEPAEKVGKVLDEAHDVFRRIWSDNISFGDGFPPPLLGEFFRDPTVKEFFREQEEFAARFERVIDWGQAPEGLMEKRRLVTNIIIGSFDFNDVPVVPLVIGKEPIAIEIPNVPIVVDDKDEGELKRGALPMPAAAVVWALSRAGTKLLARPDGYVMELIIGTQSSIPAHMQKIFDLADRQFPSDDSIYNHITIDGPRVAKAAIEEAHHLKIADTIARVRRHYSEIGSTDTGFTHILSLVGASTYDVTLRTPYAARDTAALIYSTVVGINEFKDFLLQDGQDDTRELHRVLISKGRGTDRFPTNLNFSLRQMSETLLGLADTIGAMPEGTSTKEIEQVIRRDRNNINALKDAWGRTELNTHNTLSFGDDRPTGIGIQLISRDIVPSQNITPRMQRRHGTSSEQTKNGRQPQSNQPQGLSRAERRRRMRNQGKESDPRGL